MNGSIDINAYSYLLPQERIALFPLEKRDQSKLLVYRNGNVSHLKFLSLAEQLPANTLLIFNNTKVIQARLLFEKETGATIEVFLLHPVTPSPLLLEAMQSTGMCEWQCTVGNLKRWKTGTILSAGHHTFELQAELRDREAGIVQFRWNPLHTFAEVVSAAGQVPLPPYLRRKPEEKDKERYQTIYSKAEGAVAAPTAGLHFTPGVFESLRQRGIRHEFATLHVSAGTFQPVKEQNALNHTMHSEQIVVTTDLLRLLADHPGQVIPVGTTSMRTLESIYWYGVKLMKDADAPFQITQTDAWTLPQEKSPKDALQTIIRTMEARRHDTLTGETSIYITPGYRFRISTGLITNFHQPASTLILLVAALIGEDWRKVYDEALINDYRFLSYGDSSLLLP